MGDDVPAPRAASPPTEDSRIPPPRDPGPVWEDRERAEYRGGPSSGRMKRRRSISPGYREPRERYERGRFDDYPRRDDFREPYYRREPMPVRYDRFPPPHHAAPFPMPPRVPPPEDCSYLVSFRHFSDYIESAFPSVFRNRENFDEAWNNYRTDFLRRQNAIYWQDHRSQAWFKEKYDPALRDLRTRIRDQGREGKIDTFIDELKRGDFDELSFEQTFVVNDVKPAEEKPVSPKANGDEEPKSEMDVDAPAPEPTETKVENEDEKKESMDLHQDLADEMEEDDPDKETTRRPDEDAAEPSADNKTVASTRASGDEYVNLPADEWQLVIKSVSIDISRQDLETHCAQAEGFHYVALSDPIPAKKYHRVAFVVFKPGSDMKSAEEKLFESKIREFTLHMNRSGSDAKSRVKSVPNLFSEQERASRDLVSIRRLVKRFEAEANDTRGSAALEEHLNSLAPKVEDEEAATATESSQAHIVKSLDLYLQYLRQCFHTCFYCTTVCNFSEELTRRCIKHVRRPAQERKRPTSEKDTALLKAFDEKVLMMVDPTVDAKPFGGESYDETLTRLCRDHIKVEEEGKFRCKTCTKLFKGQTFVEKHVLNKHPELLGERLQDIEYINNYVLDPNRIMPNIPTQPPVEPIRLIPTGGAAFPPFNGNPAGSGFAAPMAAYNGGGNFIANGGMRLSERIGDRLMEEPPMKRPRRDGPPQGIPAGIKPDPRSSRGFASYNDLDSTAAVGDLELEY